MYQEPENNHPWTYQLPPNFSPVSPKKPKKKGAFTALKVIALALCCSLVGGVFGSAVTMLATFRGGNSLSIGGTSTILEGEREDTVIDINKVDTDKLMTPAEVYATNVNSTVGITTSVTTNLWGYQTTSAASGSGFILTDDGYILTNYHVIESSSSITVSFFDGSSVEAALIGYDINNDIAVLKVDKTGLTPVVLGDSNNMNVGDDVVAIGNPLGELTFSLTAGTVSALKREVTTSNGITMNLIQTDCAINSGNSGGALLNLYGEVVGITNAKYSSNSTNEASIDNIGFAIPVNSVKEIIKSIIEDGFISRPYVGISVVDVSQESQSYGLPKGAAVKEVVADSPAEKAGLQVNDIITHVNGTAVSGSNELVSIAKESAIGDVLKMTVYRQGNTLELEVTVGEQIQSATQETDTTTSNDSQSVLPFSPDTFEFFPWSFGY